MHQVFEAFEKQQNVNLSKVPETYFGNSQLKIIKDKCFSIHSIYKVSRHF